jgi:DNA adenine methylase
MNAKPIIPWIGGKTRLAADIVPLFPPHTCYVEPFAGAAGILFAKEPSKSEVLNDVNGELVNLYRVLKNHLEEFVRHFKWELTSRQIFEWHKCTRPETLTDIQRAARFYYLQRTCFGGRVVGQTFGTDPTAPARLNLLRIEEDLSAAHLRLSSVVIEHLDWHDCVTRYDRESTLFFCDPPYWGTEGYGVDFPLVEYERLAEAARTVAGKMIITVNDHPEMRRVFAGFPMDVVGIKYSITAPGAERKQTGELIIRNRADGFNGQVGLL